MQPLAGIMNFALKPQKMFFHHARMQAMDCILCPEYWRPVSSRTATQDSPAHFGLCFRWKDAKLLAGVNPKRRNKRPDKKQNNLTIRFTDSLRARIKKVADNRKNESEQTETWVIHACVAAHLPELEKEMNE